ncbi:unnamed protein product [Paramecium sonneborni]|uniref:glycine--tRNA ligase n=1 Tax=Paramecium sonneborni TaxID=65129 RepID=A0A8S1M1W7_9CILI|nr:unnamed protein product [Paramecium sonneborni]
MLQQLNKEVLLKRREALEQVIKRRFIYQPAFSLYGGVAGLYDYGPVGCAIKTNIEQYWREHFIIEEDLFEIAATILTPEPVLKASGHVDRFTDLLVCDTKTGTGYRADKIVTETLEQRIAKEGDKLGADVKAKYLAVIKDVDTYKQDKMKEIIAELQIKAPETGNELTDPSPFNLMLPTIVGPSTKLPAFLRPETAQGMFLNFARLLEQNGGRVPFGAAQIGLGFRNEIAPRGGLLRCREFQMAEIEYFVDPTEKATFKKFNKYINLEIPLLSRQLQADALQHQPFKMGDAVKAGIINNETLAYFICRTYLYLVEIGINPVNIRFRQHQADEMAHYSSDCWDAEIEMSSGWVECVGLADRSAYDLNAHSNATGQKLQAARKFKVPQPRQVLSIILDKQKIGKELKKDGMALIKFVEALPDDEKLELSEYFQTHDEKVFNIDGKDLTLNKQLVKFEQKTMNVMEEKFIPHVIEPAFGIGRILQAIIEHSFNQRDDPQKTFFKFSPRVAPVKCSILSVVQNEEFDLVIQELTASLKKLGISCKTDNAGVALGKKYARTDEIGIPFAITVDKETLTAQSVTLREIETTKQVRVPIVEVPRIILELSSGLILWTDVLTKYPLFAAKEEDA